MRVREGVREGAREQGREGKRERWKEEGNGGRKREGGNEGVRKGRREGAREGEREKGWQKNRRYIMLYSTSVIASFICACRCQNLKFNMHTIIQYTMYDTLKNLVNK